MNHIEGEIWIKFDEKKPFETFQCSFLIDKPAFDIMEKEKCIASGLGPILSSAFMECVKAHRKRNEICQEENGGMGE